MVRCCRLLLLAQLVLPILSVKFPNDIEGDPVIDCNADSLTLTVTTSNGLASHMFVKGRATDAGCDFEGTNSVTISLASCGMTRQRQLEPKGVAYSLVVVVQLHPHFVTKVDRAYHVQCFYMEADKSVSQELEVSMLTTGEATATFGMPVCVYTLHMGSPDGPIVRFANVGDKVFHVWECPSDVYGILVHSCTVDDGQGNPILILDELGCETDQYVLKTPVYNAALNQAQQETHVFKFADRVQVKFNCQIRLCLNVNGDNACDGITPPRCTSNQPLIFSTDTQHANPSSHIPGTERVETIYAASPDDFDAVNAATSEINFPEDLTTKIVYVDSQQTTPSDSQNTSTAQQETTLSDPQTTTSAEQQTSPSDLQDTTTADLEPSTDLPLADTTTEPYDETEDYGSMPTVYPLEPGFSGSGDGMLLKEDEKGQILERSDLKSDDFKLVNTKHWFPFQHPLSTKPPVPLEFFGGEVPTPTPFPPEIVAPIAPEVGGFNGIPLELHPLNNENLWQVLRQETETWSESRTKVESTTTRQTLPFWLIFQLETTARPLTSPKEELTTENSTTQAPATVTNFESLIYEENELTNDENITAHEEFYVVENLTDTVTESTQLYFTDVPYNVTEASKLGAQKILHIQGSFRQSKLLRRPPIVGRVPRELPPVRDAYHDVEVDVEQQMVVFEPPEFNANQDKGGNLDFPDISRIYNRGSYSPFSLENEVCLTPGTLASIFVIGLLTFAVVLVAVVYACLRFNHKSSDKSKESTDFWTLGSLRRTHSERLFK